MWVMMNQSFVSIVQHRDKPNILLVRARKKEDLLQFLKPVPELGEEIIKLEDADYRYRVFLERPVVTELMSAAIQAIDYGNFKNSVKDHDRHQAYRVAYSALFNWAERT